MMENSVEEQFEEFRNVIENNKVLATMKRVCVSKEPPPEFVYNVSLDGHVLSFDPIEENSQPGIYFNTLEMERVLCPTWYRDVSKGIKEMMTVGLNRDKDNNNFANSVIRTAQKPKFSGWLASHVVKFYISNK